MDNKETIEEEFKIPIEELFPTFKEHLDIKKNGRILFSGKFGIGKTYFLNEFFKNKKEDYEVFHLFPVNYQITSNENIIDFLKYDILIELLKKNKSIIQKNDYCNLIDLQRLLYFWGKDNFVEIFKTGISLIPKLGKPLKDVVGLTESFWKFKQEIEASEQGFVDKFLKEIKQKDILETDSLSELLKEKIYKQKDKKQSILILDDLERIDPEHVFRIMNIFSAHLNLQNEEVPNKFGFDKVVIVADAQNLKSIFHHRYGDQTDFNGYFDKFFSIEVFQFKNEEIIAKTVDEIIGRFKVEDQGNISKGLKSPHHYLRIILKDILLKSLELDGKEKLNLRQLLKGVKFQIPAFRNENYKKDSFISKDKVFLQLINISIKALISIFGGLDIDFTSVLKEIRKNVKDKGHTTGHLGYYGILSYYLLKSVSTFEENEDGLKYGWGKYSIEIKNKVIKSVNRKIIKVESKTTLHTQADISKLFFDLLIKYVSEKFYEKEIELY